MAWQSQNIGQLPRRDSFPFRLEGVFYCNNSRFPFTGRSHTCKFFEISLRLRSESRRCEDLLDGRAMDIPFPNIVFKRPGMQVALAGDLPRDTLSFMYSPHAEELLEAWNLIPKESFLPFRLTEHLQQLVAEFHRILGCYTLPGMVDQLDWAALKLLRAVLFQRNTSEHAAAPASRIQEAALYLQHHCDQTVSCDAIAARFGFSHAAFYREWKKHFKLSPQNYILDFRLKAAAHRLVETTLPITAIVKEVHFSNLTAFHRKFRETFGVSPNAFRKDPEHRKMVFPDLTAPEGRPS